MKKTFTYLFLIAFVFVSTANAKNKKSTGIEDRKVWVEHLIKVASPVITSISNNTLKEDLPAITTNQSNRKFSYLEAVGRTVCGIAPWLELGPDNTEEGKLRKKYIELTVKGLKNCVDPNSKGRLEFRKPYQPLVDAAFLAQGLLRAPKQLWGNFDEDTKKWMIDALKETRNIKPWENNWLLFASMIEAALLEFTGEYDSERLYYCVNKFRNDWYKGDGIYGDGNNFHQDYYNSFVIHPMLTDILRIMKKHNLEGMDFLPLQEKRHGRYAAQLERFISPEGTYPVIGRSIVYRFGAFHALSHASLLHILPAKVSPEQVRCALTAVITKQLKSPENFDEKGWLTIGFAGNQIKMGETYINSGSIYLCTVGFLPLGLPADDPFWANPYSEWSSLKAWKGIDIGTDKAI